MTIIDARLRPPLKDYLRCNLYRDPKKTQGWSSNFLMKVSPAVEQRDADLLYREMDDAGVTMGVMTGRQSPGMGNVSNDDLMDIVREQPGRFVGIAGFDTQELQGDAAGHVDDEPRFAGADPDEHVDLAVLHHVGDVVEAVGDDLSAVLLDVVIGDTVFFQDVAEDFFR